MWHETDSEQFDVFQEAELKICDLCGALNLLSRRECFVCGWRGRFETRREVVRAALDMLRRREDPEALELLSETCRPRSAFHRFSGWLKRQFSRARHWLFG